MSKQLKTRLEVATQAARQAAAILMKYYGAPKISFKAEETQNLVTQADVEAEAAVLQRIRQDFPDDEVLCEESQPTGIVDAEHLWIVDPLDGTNNYAQGIPQFCVSIAYASLGQVLAGVVYDPMREEMFRAVRGEGAYLNEVPIRTSNRSNIHESVIATGFHYDRGDLMRRTLRSIESLFADKNIRGIRRLGAAALDLSWVACGRLDAFFEYRLSPWDYAAASLIVEEAGGRCGDRLGNPLLIESGSTITSNSHIFEELCSVVRWTD